jgi:hypothetical protein
MTGDIPEPCGPWITLFDLFNVHGQQAVLIKLENACQRIVPINLYDLPYPYVLLSGD